MNVHGTIVCVTFLRYQLRFHTKGGFCSTLICAHQEQQVAHVLHFMTFQLETYARRYQGIIHTLIEDEMVW